MRRMIKSLGFQGRDILGTLREPSVLSRVGCDIGISRGRHGLVYWRGQQRMWVMRRDMIRRTSLPCENVLRRGLQRLPPIPVTGLGWEGVLLGQNRGGRLVKNPSPFWLKGSIGGCICLRLEMHRPELKHRQTRSKANALTVP